jgi:two-component system response regulator AtoC
VVERAVLLSRGSAIEVEHLQVDPEFSGGALRGLGSAPAHALPTPPGRSEASRPSASSQPLPGGSLEPEKLRDEVGRLERERIVEAIARCGGNQTKAAELLGISRRALLHRLDAYGLPRPRKGS